MTANQMVPCLPGAWLFGHIFKSERRKTKKLVYISRASTHLSELSSYGLKARSCLETLAVHVSGPLLW